MAVQNRALHEVLHARVRWSLAMASLGSYLERLIAVQGDNTARTP